MIGFAMALQCRCNPLAMKNERKSAKIRVKRKFSKIIQIFMPDILHPVFNNLNQFLLRRIRFRLGLFEIQIRLS
jgi:hypothetical protein